MEINKIKMSKIKLQKVNETKTLFSEKFHICKYLFRLIKKMHKKTISGIR